MRRLSLVVMMVALGLLNLAACGQEPQDDLDFNPSRAEGYAMTRALELGDPALLNGPTVKGRFDPTRYAAHWFKGEAGQQLDILALTDFRFSQLANQILANSDKYGISILVFQANFSVEALERAGLEGRAALLDDPDSWNLLREDNSPYSGETLGFDTSGFGKDFERTKITLPQSSYYMIVLLTTDAAYAEGLGYNLDIASIEPGDTTPGSISGTISSYSLTAGAIVPVVNARVAVGNQVVFTDAQGSFQLDNLYPNVYTLKLGPEGYTHCDTVVRPGRNTELNFQLTQIDVSQK